MSRIDRRTFIKASAAAPLIVARSALGDEVSTDDAHAPADVMSPKDQS